MFLKRTLLNLSSLPFEGKEIMKICKINEGPNVGKIKKRIEEAILNGDIQNSHKKP